MYCTNVSRTIASSKLPASIPLLFDTEADALAFIERHKADAPLIRPIDTGRHVYSNWEPVMQHRGSSDPRRDPHANPMRIYAVHLSGHRRR